MPQLWNDGPEAAQEQRGKVMEDHDKMSMPNSSKTNETVLANLEGHLLFYTATRCALASASQMNEQVPNKTVN